MDKVMSQLYDKNGIPIMVGDLLKVYHYTGARRKKHYLYRLAMWIRESKRKGGGSLLMINYLSFDKEFDPTDCYALSMDGRVMEDDEIIQSACSVYSEDVPRFEDRKRKEIEG